MYWALERRLKSTLGWKHLAKGILGVRVLHEEFFWPDSAVETVCIPGVEMLVAGYGGQWNSGGRVW